jgi:hypothetical protein
VGGQVGGWKNDLEEEGVKLISRIALQQSKRSPDFILHLFLN